MTIAFLIGVHADPPSVRRLVDSLGDAAIYIHVDARVDDGPFRAAAPKARFVSDRVSVVWGGWAQVRASLSLLRAGLEDMRNDRFIFLSGDSFPTQKSTSITDFFASTPAIQYIDAVGIPSSSQHKPLSRISRYYFAHDRDYTAVSMLARAANRLALPVNYRRLLGEWRPYGGSAWWAITREAAENCISVAQERPGLVRLAKHAKMPDEFFYQTALLNSFPVSLIRPSIMYDDWSHPVERPAVIDPGHISLLASSQLRMTRPEGDTRPVLFLRKVRSEPIAALIRDVLWPVSLDLG